MAHLSVIKRARVADVALKTRYGAKGTRRAHPPQQPAGEFLPLSASLRPAYDGEQLAGVAERLNSYVCRCAAE